MRNDALFLAGAMTLLAGEMVIIHWLAGLAIDTLWAALF